MICILDVLGGRTSATRDTRLMCIIKDPVIPDTNASLPVLYPSVILVSFKVSVTHSHKITAKTLSRPGVYKPYLDPHENLVQDHRPRGFKSGTIYRNKNTRIM